MQGFTSKTIACTSVCLIDTHFQDQGWNPTEVSGDRVELSTIGGQLETVLRVSFFPSVLFRGITSSNEGIRHPHLKITVCGAVLEHLGFSPSAFPKKHF